MDLQSPNQRLPCGQTTSSVSVIRLGGCWSNYFTNSKAPHVWTNITKVPDYHGATFGQPIDPYPRPYLNNPTVDSCIPADPPCCDPLSASQECCGYPTSSDFFACATPDGNHATINAIALTTQTPIVRLDYHNCFSSSNATMSLNECSPGNYKNVYARKRWSGVYNYRSNYYLLTSIPGGAADVITSCCNCSYVNPDTSSFDTTKYLGVSANGTRTVTCESLSGPCYNHTDTAANACHIDRYTGNLTVDTCTSSSTNSSSDPDAASADAADWFSQLVVANNRNEPYLTFCSRYGDATSIWGTPTTITGTDNNWHLEWTGDLGCGTVTMVIMDFTPTALDITYYGYDSFAPDFCASYGQVGEYHFHVGDFTMTIGETSTGYTESIKFTTTTEITGVIDSSTAYTADEAYIDAISALNSFPLNDDIVYPWKKPSAATDTTLGPLVEYDEDPSTGPYIGTCTGSVGGFTGQLIGVPQRPPSGSTINRWWNGEAEIWETCEQTCYDEFHNPIGTITQWYIRDVGQYSTDADAASPPLAENWMNKLQAYTYGYDGGLIGMSYGVAPETCDLGPIRVTDDFIWVKKEARIPTPRNSVNYARPCGIDRWQTNGAYACITGSSGSILYVDDTSPLSAGSASVCGTGNNGIWQITILDSHRVQLGNNFVTQSQFQPAFTCSAASPYNGVVSNIRWPNTPPICGRLSIPSIINQTPITCSMEDNTYLVDGDSVTISSSSISSMNGTWTVKLLNNSPYNIVLSASVSSSTVYVANSGVMTSPLQTKDYKWNDNKPKGDFAFLSTFYNPNNRINGEADRLIAQSQSLQGFTECPPTTPGTVCTRAPLIDATDLYTQSCDQQCYSRLSPCHLPVLVITPSTSSVDDFPNQVKHVIPKPVFDGVYGTLTNVVVVESQTCPFYIDYPNCTGHSLTFDDGECTADQPGHIPPIYYKPLAPFVEFRCSPPTGSPSLPGDVVVGCGGIGSPCNPPVQGMPPTPPWLTAEFQCACIAADGRWADIYEENFPGQCTEEFPI